MAVAPETAPWPFICGRYNYFWFYKLYRNLNVLCIVIKCPFPLSLLKGSAVRSLARCITGTHQAICELRMLRSDLPTRGLWHGVPTERTAQHRRAFQLKCTEGKIYEVLMKWFVLGLNGGKEGERARGQLCDIKIQLGPGVIFIILKHIWGDDPQSIRLPQ